VISKGGFTSCVQANPRWEMTSGSLRLRVDHYALLSNMMLKVKGVPALYLPYMYYPLSKDNRSTGFLMPSYGSSTYKGHTISNAFFWAINRSQDATFLHDWYSKTGQSVAGEYRYVSLGGAGNLRTNFLNERPIRYVLDGEELEQAGRRTFGAYGNLSQALGGCGAGARRLLVRPDGRSALQHRHRESLAADQIVRRIGERHDQGDPPHRRLRSQRILRRERHVVGAR
jgi:lipopolysaccharide assembly outer membrane protein LptD (OstA)